MRRGVLTSPAILPNSTQLVGVSEWAAWITSAMIADSERQARAKSQINATDKLWAWIDSLDDGSKTAQNVPFKKSLYSLAHPMHDRVFKHLRYMQNFLSTDFDTSDLADTMLAIAFKYRHMPSVRNTTTTNIVTTAAADLLRQRCSLAGLLSEPVTVRLTQRFEGETLFPLYRDPNPSPLGALQYLLRKERNVSLNYPLRGAPWPLTTVHAVAHFPTRECDWVYSRLYAGSDDSGKRTSATGKPEALPLQTPIPYEKYTSTDPVLCRPSNFHPDALPRISEDGGQCGRLAIIQIGFDTCQGTPSSMVGCVALR